MDPKEKEFIEYVELMNALCESWEETEKNIDEVLAKTGYPADEYVYDNEEDEDYEDFEE